MSNILQNSQDRLNKIHQTIQKESAKKRASLDNTSYSTDTASQKTPKDVEAENSSKDAQK